jgi:hypothetical protein
MDDLGHWTTDLTHGTRDRWEIRAHGTSPKSDRELLSAILDKVAHDGRWRVVTSTTTTARLRRDDAGGMVWQWTVAIESIGQAGELKLQVEVERVGG